MADRYVITKRAGVDTAHHNPGERCNLDDTEADKVVTEDEAIAAVSSGDAAPCKHCWQEAEFGHGALPDA